MKNIIKISGAVMFCAMLALSAFAVPVRTAQAETTNDYDRTAIEDDLKNIALDKYQKNEKGTPSLITFSEYCYSNDEEIAQKYGLYFYIYNPAEDPLSVKSGANVINMATSYDDKGEPKSYGNCSLTYLDASDNHRFYKFKLTESAETLKRAKEYATAHEGVRRYDFAGVQLRPTGTDKPKDCGISATYRCTGYGAGCDILGSQQSTLSYDASKLETIALDLYQTCYRQEGINQNGAGHHNQLSSVYFAIPKEKMDTYGGLSAVKCTWDEARTAPIIVTNNRDVYDDVSAHLGTDGKGGAYRIYDNYKVYTAMGVGAHAEADWAYNSPYVGETFTPVIPLDHSPVGYVFKSSKSNVKDTDISAAEMQEWIKGHGNADYLFTDDVDVGRLFGPQEKTFYADDLFDIRTFNSASSGWDKFCLGWQQFWSGKSWDWGTDELDVEPIKHVTDDDFKGTDTLNANGLFVNESDYGVFKSFYDKNKWTNDIFLLRFAVTDYYSNLQSVVKANDFWASGEMTSTYMARETVFREFDIIELTFQKDGEETVLGVVASPIDVVGGVDAPNDKELTWWERLWEVLKNLPWWAWLIIAGLVVGLLCAIKPVFEIVVFLLKGVFYIVTAPIWLIVWLVKRKR